MARTQRELKGQISDMNLRAVKQERELKRKRTSKADLLLLRSTTVSQLLRQRTEEEKNRNEKIRRPFLLIR